MRRGRLRAGAVQTQKSSDFKNCAREFLKYMFKLSKLQKWLSVCLILTLVPLLYTILMTIRDDVIAIRIQSPVLPILVMACNRPSVKRCLESIIRYRPDKRTFPIVVSQDCRHEETYRIIKSFADQDPSITLVQQPDQSDIPRHNVYAHLKGYYRIARHYKFALNHVFRKLKHKAVIILEDDLEISTDFFEYFLATYPLLYQDPTIWCVSAWNDNCRQGLVELDEPELLHRTDFFPGLGWMLLSHTWDELEPKWPEAYFDDWLRNPNVSRGRVCIRPEISRTFNFGRHGVSNTHVFDRHLRHTILNKKHIPFTSYDLSYLQKKYELRFFTFVYSLPKVTDLAVMTGTINGSWKYVRVPYTNIKSFKKSAKMFGLMDDFRNGVPRTALRGIVQCFVKGKRVFLTPKKKRIRKSLN